MGFSARKCIADILADRVSLDQVVIINANTRVPTRDGWQSLMTEYHKYGALGIHPIDKVLTVSGQLWDSGKIHQAQVFGAPYALTRNYVWMDLVHTKEDRDIYPALAEAWAEIQLLEMLVTGTGI